MSAATKKKGKRRDSLSEIRAFLGKVRTKGHKVGDREKAFNYRIQLQKVLMKARVSSSISRPEEFFSALDEVTKLDIQRVANQPIGHDYLLQLLSAKPLPIEKEMLWVAARIKHEKPIIESFLKFASNIEQHILRDELSGALELISQCEKEIGVSLWSTELRISLTQSSAGTDAQKAILKSIKSIRRVGMWPYVANLASTRAEATVSISWFIAEAKRRHSRIKRNEFSDYSNYRATGEWPESKSGAGRVLRVEQNHHIVDLYETFVSFLQQSATQRQSETFQASIVSAIASLDSLDDFRIRKLEFITRGKISERLQSAPLGLVNELLGQSRSKVLKEELVRALRAPLSAESAFALALSVTRPALAENSPSSVRNTVVRGLAEGLLRRGHQAEFEGRASERCKKFFHTYRQLPFAQSLRNIFEAAVQPNTRLAARHMQLAALNSNAWGFLDIAGFAQYEQHAALAEAIGPCSAVDFSTLLAMPEASAANMLLREDVASFAKAASLTIKARPESASHAIANALLSQNRVVATQAATVALNAYARTGEIEKASALIAKEHVEFGVDPEALPVRDVYQDLEWSEMEDASQRPELSIALSLIQSTEGDDKLRTYRRFALETLLMSFSVSNPSELRAVATGWPKSMLRYFLDKVCTPAMLDMLPAIRSTREVLEERREIAGYLATLDKEGSERHTQEVIEISRDLAVLDGLRTIDGSRVHVDKESLAKRLRTELAESYQRYVSLIRDEGPQGDAFVSILKDLSNAGRKPDYLYEMPVSEPDELLVSIILRCREQFLMNVPHGLDSYISKRIRHGSIVGVVRAPAERLGVVAKRNLDGTYRPGGTWADNVRDPSQRAALSVAITAASKAIDQHLIRLKDTLLHVKSPQKPHGLLDAPLTPAGYLLIRSVAQADTTLDSFIETMFGALWGMLGASLLQVHAVLTKESAPLVASQVQGLRARAQKVLVDPDERAAFDSAAGNASMGMQAALAAAANWFEPVESGSRTYSVSEVVQIALAAVRATTTDFSPEMEIGGNSTYSFSELVLPLLCDVFYIAFGNVASHAPADAKIWVQVDKDSDGRHLLFKVESTLGEKSQQERMALKDKLAQIRSDIASSHGENRARSEGGSGLYKLANIVVQSEGGSLEFDFSDDLFQLKAKLGYSEGSI